MESKTPLRDAWNAYKDRLDTSREFTNLRNLAKGDYVLIVKTGTERAYAGEIVSVGKVNVKVKMPYGGYADSDFITMQDIKFLKTEIVKFYKPKT